MKRLQLRIFVLFSTLFLLTACEETKYTVMDPSKTVYKSEWAVSGTVANAGYSHGEVIALGIDGTRYRSQIDERNRFSIELPGNATYAFYFFGTPAMENNSLLSNSEVMDTAVGASLPRGPAALLHFEESPEVGIRDSLRLPKVLDNRRLNLGEIDIKGNKAFPTSNPASRLDFDGDGINDFADRDDQNDGLPDAEQRKETEHVDVCHVSAKDGGKEISVPLNQALPHLLHGDGSPPCRATQNRQPMSNPNNDLSGLSDAPSPNIPVPELPDPGKDSPIPLNRGDGDGEEAPDDEEGADNDDNEHEDEDQPDKEDHDDVKPDNKPAPKKVKRVRKKALRH